MDLSLGMTFSEAVNDALQAEIENSNPKPDSNNPAISTGLILAENAY